MAVARGAAWPLHRVEDVDSVRKQLSCLDLKGQEVARSQGIDALSQRAVVGAQEKELDPEAFVRDVVGVALREVEYMLAVCSYRVVRATARSTYQKLIVQLDDLWLEDFWPRLMCEGRLLHGSGRLESCGGE